MTRSVLIRPYLLVDPLNLDATLNAAKRYSTANPEYYQRPFSRVKSVAMAVPLAQTTLLFRTSLLSRNALRSFTTCIPSSSSSSSYSSSELHRKKWRQPVASVLEFGGVKIGREGNLSSFRKFIIFRSGLVQNYEPFRLIYSGYLAHFQILHSLNWFSVSLFSLSVNSVIRRYGCSFCIQ